jgi:hypothetical protein
MKYVICGFRKIKKNLEIIKIKGYLLDFLYLKIQRFA